MFVWENTLLHSIPNIARWYKHFFFLLFYYVSSINQNMIFHIFYMQYSHAKTDIITMAKISVFFVIKRRHIFFCSKQKSILRLTFFVSKLYIAFKIFSSIHLYLQFLAFLFFSYLGVCHIHKTGINLPSRRMYSV